MYSSQLKNFLLDSYKTNSVMVKNVTMKQTITMNKNLVLNLFPKKSPAINYISVNVDLKQLQVVILKMFHEKTSLTKHECALVMDLIKKFESPFFIFWVVNFCSIDKSNMDLIEREHRDMFYEIKLKYLGEKAATEYFELFEETKTYAASDEVHMKMIYAHPVYSNILYNLKLISVDGTAGGSPEIKGV